MTQADLFSLTYPKVPGSATTDTSIAAAKDVAGKAPRLRQQVLDVLSDYGSLTADEVAELLDLDKLSIRPRLTELSKLGQITDTGTRRANQSGKKAIVWAVKPQERFNNVVNIAGAKYHGG